MFGNTGDKPGWVTFDPRVYGMEPLSVMAIVCNNKLVCILSYSSKPTCVPKVDREVDLWHMGRHER